MTKTILSAFAALALIAPNAHALPRPVVASYARGAQFEVAGYDASKSALADFPVLVRIVNDSPSGFAYSQLQSPSDGADLCFIDMNGNGLPFEIDTWNPDGTSLIWVKLPTMAQGAQFVMCWGSATSGKTVCGDNPFAGYKGVWHMNSTSPADASGSGNDGTGAGSVALVGGVVGSGLSYPDKSSYVSCGSSQAEAELTANGYTIEGWVNLAGLSGNQALFGKSGFISYRMEGTSVKITTPAVADYGSVGNFITAANEWHYFALSFIPNTTAGAKHYMDGVLKTEQNTGGINNKTDSIEMWLARNQWGNDQGFVGLIDEYRLSPTVRSADWIAASRATQIDPAFLTAGAAQSYEESAAPDVGLVAPPSAVRYTNATLTATIGSLGKNEGMTAAATWVDPLLVVSRNDDLSDPVFALPLSRVSSVPVSVPVSVLPLVTNTTYYAQLRATNSFGVAGESGVAAFTTLDPQPPAGSVLFHSRGFTTLAASATVSDFGTGSASATARVEASASSDFATIAAASAETAADVGASANHVVPGLAPDTSYFLRLRIVNEWGLVSYVPLAGSYPTRAAPLAATGVGYAFSADNSTVDFTFGVTEVFDGATLSATLEYGGQTFDERTFSQAGSIEWNGIPAARGVQTAVVTVTSVLDGTTYAQTWTATIDLRTRAYAVSRLADLSNLALCVGDTVTLPEPTGADDYYAVMDIRSFGLGEDGVTLTALEPGFSAVLLMKWNAATGSFEADPVRALALCVPEPEGNGRVFFARPGSGKMNWADTSAWRNLTDGTPDYPRLANDVAMAALPSDQLVLDASATVAELYIGEDEKHLHGAIRLTGKNSATLTFRRSSGKPGLLRLTGHGRIVEPVLTNGWTEVHIGGGEGNSTATGLGIEMLGGLVFDGGAWPDYTAWDSDEMKDFARARYIMGDNMRFWNIPEGKTLRVVNTYSRYKMTGDDQGGNANFVWNNGGQVTGRGTLLYDGAASTYIDDPFYLFEGTVAVRNKQRYDSFSMGSRGGSFWMVNWTQPTRAAPNATLLVEGDVGYNNGLSVARSYGAVSYGNAHGYGSWGYTTNALPGKKWIMNGGVFYQAGMNNNSASWREDGTTATQPIRVPNGAETLCVSNGFSLISVSYQQGDADRPTNNLEFARLEHAGDGVLVAGNDRTWYSYQNSGAGASWRTRLVLGGFHDHAIGGTGAADAIHGPAGVRTNILESTAPIVPWIVAPVEAYSSLYFPGASPEGELVMAGHPKAVVLDTVTEPTMNVCVSDKTIALSADRTVNSLRVVNNRVNGKNLGAGRTLTITSGGLIMGNGNWNNTAFIGDESGYNAGTAGTIYFPNKAYVFAPVVNSSKNYHPEIWARMVSPKGAVFSFPGYLDLGGDQTGIDDHIAVNGTYLTLGSSTTGCEIDVPVHLHGAYSTLAIARQGSFCFQDLYFWDHATPGATFVPPAGAQERVRKMWIDGASQPRGYYGSSESGVEDLAEKLFPAFVDDRHFSGTGWIKVMTDEVLQPTLLFLR